LGSGIRKEILTQIQWSKKHRIPDPQHWFLLSLKFFFSRYKTEHYKYFADRLELLPVPLTGLPANVLHQLEILVGSVLVHSPVHAHFCNLGTGYTGTYFVPACVHSVKP
jgi:hypothetical protein